MDETRDLIQIMKLTKTKAGGGTWYHGFEDGQVKSNYNHTKRLTNQVRRLVEKGSFHLNGRKKMKGIPTLQCIQLFGK
ncbi:lactococcin 972 family bacteriocin [Bacillus inaquosorum]|nr:lactococcin 972 family bacteriocin [Bacillus inaquosorum]